jgi:3-dehydroquinate dehydratase II
LPLDDLQAMIAKTEVTMAKSILILNGPNLNLLGTREPHIYGSTSLAEVQAMCEARCKELGIALTFRQSNHEGQLIDWVQEAIKTTAGLIINPAGFTTTSIALLDALKMFNGPIIELHITNIHRREAFRHNSYISLAATGVMCGLGVKGYVLAIDAVHHMITTAKG